MGNDCGTKPKDSLSSASDNPMIPLDWVYPSFKEYRQEFDHTFSILCLLYEKLAQVLSYWTTVPCSSQWAFLFLSVPFRDTLDSNYDTNKTQLDEAPFGRADDDYGPGSEPSPHDRLRYVSTFMPSRRRPPAAVGKPSFPRFKVYYLLRRRVRFEPRPLDFRERDLPNAT
ncbi:hypothetical protein THAOC_18452, partial [Thalassiosira oceanica]